MTTEIQTYEGHFKTDEGLENLFKIILDWKIRNSNFEIYDIQIWPGSANNVSANMKFTDKRDD